MPYPPSHYYGDQVRKLFVAGAVIMAGFLPFYASNIAAPILMSVVAILILGVAAGLTSPKSPITALLDMLISLAAVTVFESYAVSAYIVRSMSYFFLITQTLAIIFVCALYYSTKTLRGMSRA